MATDDFRGSVFTYGEAAQTDPVALEPKVAPTVPEVVLRSVPFDLVWGLKDSAQKVLSLRLPDTNTGFINVPLDASRITAQSDGYRVALDGDAHYLVHSKDDTGLSKRSMSAHEIQSVYEQTYGISEHHAYLCDILAQSIRTTKRADWHAVSVEQHAPDGVNALSVLVHKSAVLPPASRTANRVDVDLGPQDRIVDYAVKRGVEVDNQRASAETVAQMFSSLQKAIREARGNTVQERLQQAISRENMIGPEHPGI